jgi:hypothetical protein
MRIRSFEGVVIALSLLLSACANDMFSGDNTKKGMAAISQKLGYPDLLVSRVIITKDRIEAYAQHPKNPQALTQVFYSLKLGVGFGGNVQIDGGGKAQDIAFHASRIDWGLVPAMVKKVKEKTSSPISQIQIEHGLSTPDPLMWDVEIKSGDLALFELDGRLRSYTTRAEREAAGAHFDY